MQTKPDPYNPSDPLSIFSYSGKLIGNSLHSLLGDEIIMKCRKGKGSLGQLVEEAFFNYGINSDRNADFKEAGLELKCTPLLKSKTGNTYRIKERLVCTMIDYNQIVNTPFEESHLIAKCRLMLLLFYLHISGHPIYELQFIYRILWDIPEKDLILIKRDYDVIAEKVKRGEAHLLSEGDTLYLGACRKGQKGDPLQAQPNSEIGANKRAFSLKPAYMRYILSHVEKSGKTYYTNYVRPDEKPYELVGYEELKDNSFEQIVLKRFEPFFGLNYNEICDKLGIESTQSKNKYADVCSLIGSDKKSRHINQSEEFTKSGITMKTVRLRNNGMPRESMSFKNIDYEEILDNDNWIESELYEIFTSRFMFVVFRPDSGHTITVKNKAKKIVQTEVAYVLDKVFFWTMPQDQLNLAQSYWENIRKNVLANNITNNVFWSIADKKSFHVRPKATTKADKTPNPHGGVTDKLCYWFNAEYVKQIINQHDSDGN